MRVIKLDYPDAPDVTRELTRVAGKKGALLQVGTALLRQGHRIPEVGDSSHEGIEVSVVLDGVLDVLCGGEMHRLTAGNLVVVPAGEPHHTMVLEEAHLVYVFLNDAA